MAKSRGLSWPAPGGSGLDIGSWGLVVKLGAGWGRSGSEACRPMGQWLRYRPSWQRSRLGWGIGGSRTLAGAGLVLDLVGPRDLGTNGCQTGEGARDQAGARRLGPGSLVGDQLAGWASQEPNALLPTLLTF